MALGINQIAALAGSFIGLVLGGFLASLFAGSSNPLIAASAYAFGCSMFIPTLVGLAAPVLVIPFLLLMGWSGMSLLSKGILARI